MERFTFVLAVRWQSQPPTRRRSFIHDHFLCFNETYHLRPVPYKLRFFLVRTYWYFLCLSVLFSSMSLAVVHGWKGKGRQVREYLRMKPVSRNRLSRESQKNHAGRERNSISSGDNTFPSLLAVIR